MTCAGAPGSLISSAGVEGDSGKGTRRRTLWSSSAMKSASPLGERAIVLPCREVAGALGEVSAAFVVGAPEGVPLAVRLADVWGDDASGASFGEEQAERAAQRVAAEREVKGRTGRCPRTGKGRGDVPERYTFPAGWGAPRCARALPSCWDAEPTPF